MKTTLEHLIAIVVTLVVVVVFRYIWHDLLHLQHSQMAFRWLLREYHTLRTYLSHHGILTSDRE